MGNEMEGNDFKKIFWGLSLKKVFKRLLEREIMYVIPIAIEVDKNLVPQKVDKN